MFSNFQHEDVNGIVNLASTFLILIILIQMSSFIEIQPSVNCLLNKIFASILLIPNVRQGAIDFIDFGNEMWFVLIGTLSLIDEPQVKF